MHYVIVRCEDYAPLDAQAPSRAPRGRRGRRGTDEGTVANRSWSRWKSPKARAEGGSPRRREPKGAPSLLEGSRTPHLLQLAQAGTVGVVRMPDRAWDRLRIHGLLLGLQPQDPEAAAGRWYAATVRRQLADSETAWCCDFITQQDGRVVDPLAGEIPTTESRVLIQALNEQLGSDARRWEVGEGSHHVLVVRGGALGPSSSAAIRPPETIGGQRWNDELPRGSGGGAVRLLIEQSSKVLETHPVNRVRIDLGENPANLVWLWGPGQARTGRSFAERTGLSGAVVSRAFPMRGFAQSLGLRWIEGAGDAGANALKRLMRGVPEWLRRHPLIYLHLQIASASPVERFCAMERIDQFVLKPLTALLAESGPWRLATVVDDRASHGLPFVAIGTGLAQRPAVRLTAAEFAERGLVIEEPESLFSWLTAE